MKFPQCKKTDPGPVYRGDGGGLPCSIGAKANSDAAAMFACVSIGFCCGNKVAGMIIKELQRGDLQYLSDSPAKKGVPEALGSGISFNRPIRHHIAACGAFHLPLQLDPGFN